VLVAEHLDFDMARIGDEFLDEDAIVAEGRRPPRTSTRAKPSPPRRRSAGDAHALPPPPAEALIITG